MILIVGPLGTVLHTADFRFSGPEMIEKENFGQIDYLYLDNTFLTPDENFPTQRESFNQLVKLITELSLENENSQNSKTKFYIYCYNLGKEEVFVNLSKHFNTKIVVLSKRLTALEAIGISDYFITE
jgi:mRNA degradation ribonuclease J1/J2